MKSLQILSGTINDTFLPPGIIYHYQKLQNKPDIRKIWETSREEELWKELCFCILSGNVSYELATSTTEKLYEKGFLDYDWILKSSSAFSKMFEFLDSSNFEPRKKNGDLRKYRYPKKRAQEIVKAARTIYSSNSIKQILIDDEDDVNIRSYFYHNISGLGIKESSHFLRNIGFTDSLAIIDVHVMNFLKELYLVEKIDNSTLSEKNYIIIERIIQNLSDYHGLNLAIFDLAIWYYMRSKVT